MQTDFQRKHPMVKPYRHPLDYAEQCELTKSHYKINLADVRNLMCTCVQSILYTVLDSKFLQVQSFGKFSIAVKCQRRFCK